VGIDSGIDGVSAKSTWRMERSPGRQQSVNIQVEVQPFALVGNRETLA
jgi:hypothetical protein